MFDPLLISSFLNTVIFFVVALGMCRDDRWVRRLYGSKSPARSALLAIYTTAFLFSLLITLGFFKPLLIPMLVFYLLSLVIMIFLSKIFAHRMNIIFLFVGIIHCLNISNSWSYSSF
jgi:hypothetical protein